MMILLPEEVVAMEILTKLPVKSLVRFMSVCKSWMDLIQNSPSFIHTHLTTMKNKNTTTSSSYHVDHNSCDGVEVTTKEWSGCSTDYMPKSPYDILKLNLGPCLPYTTPYSIIGYSDGIFCLSWNHLPRYKCKQRGHTVIALCNPAIRQLRILPLANTDFPPYRKRFSVDIGFGFDPTTNDYKVVKMVMFDRREEEKGRSLQALDCIEVYSMACDSWRMVLTKGNNNYPMACNLRPPGRAGGICTSAGVLYWTMAHMADSETNIVIVSFHMDKDDSVHVTNLPSKYVSYYGPKNRYLSLLDDKLTLICSYYKHRKRRYSRIEIFQLMIDNSWSLTRVVVDSLPIHIHPLGFWLTSWLLVFNCQDEKKPLMLYDTVTKEYMDVHQLTSERGFFYRESLVSVRRGGCDECCYSAFNVAFSSDFQIRRASDQLNWE